MRRTGLGGAMVMAVLAATSLAAQPIAGGSNGLSQPTQTIDFSEVLLGANTPVFDQWSPFGVLVSGTMFSGSGPGAGRFPTAAIYNYSLQPALCCTSMFALFFTSVLHGVAFNFISDPSSTVFEAYLSGQLVSQFTATTGQNQSLWYGFENIAFDQIQVTVGGPMVAAGLDNLELSTAVSAVPEPGTVWLMGTGLLLVGVAGWVTRRRRLIARN